jgi:hypothetical protein
LTIAEAEMLLDGRQTWDPASADGTVSHERDRDRDALSTHGKEG